MTYIKISDIINKLVTYDIIKSIYQPVTYDNYIIFKKIGEYNKIDNILLYEQIKDNRSIKIYNVIYNQTELDNITHISSSLIDIIKIILTENNNIKCLKFSFKINDKVSIDKIYGHYIFYDDDEVIEEFDKLPTDIINKLLNYI